jgi:hypothetical protein
MMRRLSDRSRLQVAAAIATVPAIVIASRRAADRPLVIGIVAGIIMSVAICFARLSRRRVA